MKRGVICTKAIALQEREGGRDGARTLRKMGVLVLSLINKVKMKISEKVANEEAEYGKSWNTS